MSTDPTAIEIRFDPRAQRMEGYAYHGDTYFSVPYMSQIDHNLWQGGCADGLVLPSEIVHVVSLYPWEEYTVAHDLRSKLSVRMYDSLDQSYEQIETLAEWVNVCQDDGPTLVHCQAGLNRSSLVAARALMKRGLSADEAIDMIREKRSPACLCNPAFEEWLREQ